MQALPPTVQNRMSAKASLLTARNRVEEAHHISPNTGLRSVAGRVGEIRSSRGCSDHQYVRGRTQSFPQRVLHKVRVGPMKMDIEALFALALALSCHVACVSSASNPILPRPARASPGVIPFHSHHVHSPNAGFKCTHQPSFSQPP